MQCGRNAETWRCTRMQAAHSHVTAYNYARAHKSQSWVFDFPALKAIAISQIVSRVQLEFPLSFSTTEVWPIKPRLRELAFLSQKIGRDCKVLTK